MTISRSKTVNIEIKKTEFKDVDYVDIRKYSLDKDKEEFVPTKSGIMLKIEEVADVIKELSSLIKNDNN